MKKLIIVVVLVAVLAGVLAVAALAENEIPQLPTNYNTAYFQYVYVFSNGGTYIMYASQYRAYFSSGFVKTDFHGSSQSLKYTYNVNNGSWGNSETYGNFTEYEGNSAIVYANIDVLNSSNGTVFFYQPMGVAPTPTPAPTPVPTLSPAQLLRQARTESLQGLSGTIFSTASVVSGKGLLILSTLLIVSLIVFFLRRKIFSSKRH